MCPCLTTGGPALPRVQQNFCSSISCSSISAAHAARLAHRCLQSGPVATLDFCPYSRGGAEHPLTCCGCRDWVAEQGEDSEEEGAGGVRLGELSDGEGGEGQEADSGSGISEVAGSEGEGESDSD